MTKALLSQTDIKLFILNSINEILLDDIYLNKTNLCKKLNINQNRLDTYRTNGMPFEIYRGKTRYKLKDVIKWLDLNGKKYSYNEISGTIQEF